MGIWSRLLGNEPLEAIEESAGQTGAVERHGYEYGVPMGGVDSDQRARSFAETRQSVMEQLYQAYLSCSPASACIDTTARMVTAGGLQLVPDSSEDGKNRPPAIQQLDALIATTNPQEDLIQLLRSTIADLLTFGDGWIETGTIASVVCSLWTLDGTTMAVKCDEHGEITGFYQQVDGNRNASFEIDEVIHVSLDSPRGGVYGVSPMQKLLVPITAWLYTSAVLKEYMRQGAPPRIAVDLGKGTSDTDTERFRQQYVGRNLGPRNQGKPIVTRVHQQGATGEPPIKELSVGHIADLLATLSDLRDQIISGFGMTPAMIGIIESGNLGGGTGESQARTFHYGTVIPLQSLLLEKLNFRLLRSQGVTGWKFQFGEVEYRDSVTVENIRDQRLRNGSYTLNDYLAEIGKETISDQQGGNLHVMVDRQNIIVWDDMEAFSKANLDAKNQSAITAGVVQPASPETPDAPAAPPSATAPPVPPAAAAAVKPGEPAKESTPGRDARAVREAWERDYRAQLKAVREELDA